MYFNLVRNKNNNFYFNVCFLFNFKMSTYFTKIKESILIFFTTIASPFRRVAEYRVRPFGIQSSLPMLTTQVTWPYNFVRHSSIPEIHQKWCVASGLEPTTLRIIALTRKPLSDDTSRYKPIWFQNTILQNSYIIHSHIDELYNIIHFCYRVS